MILFSGEDKGSTYSSQRRAGLGPRTPRFKLPLGHETQWLMLGQLINPGCLIIGLLREQNGQGEIHAHGLNYSLEEGRDKNGKALLTCSEALIALYYFTAKNLSPKSLRNNASPIRGWGWC